LKRHAVHGESIVARAADESTAVTFTGDKSIISDQ